MASSLMVHLKTRTFLAKRLGMALLLTMGFAGWAVVGCSAPVQNNSNTNSNQNTTNTNHTNGNTNSNTNIPQPPEKPAGCHPMAKDGPKGGCMLPFPSSYYLRKDSSSATGFRVAFPEKLPAADHGDTQYPLKTEFFNKRDGFSPATPILALFEKWVDAKTLVKSDDIAKSVKPDSPVQLIEFGSRKRIPLFAEVDHRAVSGQPQVVIVRPMVRLQPKARYAVVFMKSVKAEGGTELTAPAVYRKLAEGQAASTPEEAALAPLLQETWDELKATGLDRSQILLAWDFRTGSDEPLFQEMIDMRDRMFQEVGDKGPSYTIRNVFNFTEQEKKEVMRIIQGVMKVPSYMDKDIPGGVLLRDEQGKPKIRGLGEFRFQVHIPRCVAEKKTPVPLMVFGHGLFGSANGEMDSGYQRELIHRLCMVQIGHDWIGLSEADSGPVGANVLTNFNNMPQITDRLQQAHINAVAMIRMALRQLIKEKALEINGTVPIDGKEVYYLGISNGAIQGGTLMALTPDIERGILNVGAGNWSMMISRSSNFSALAVMMNTFYADPVEQQLLMALVQVYFDIVDPITYAPYVLTDTKRFGVPPKKLLIQEGIGDAQVPNIATRTWARTLNIPGVGPLFEPSFGIEEKPGPFADSAYIQYGPKPTPFPEDKNVPAKTNSTHEAVRRAESCIKQMEAFFKPEGKIQQFCQDTCDPN